MKDRDIFKFFEYLSENFYNTITKVKLYTKLVQYKTILFSMHKWCLFTNSFNAQHRKKGKMSFNAAPTTTFDALEQMSYKMS